MQTAATWQCFFSDKKRLKLYFWVSKFKSESNITSMSINDFEPQQWYWSQGARSYYFSPDPCINFATLFYRAWGICQKTLQPRGLHIRVQRRSHFWLWSAEEERGVHANPACFHFLPCWKVSMVGLHLPLPGKKGKYWLQVLSLHIIMLGS